MRVSIRQVYIMKTLHPSKAWRGWGWGGLCDPKLSGHQDTKESLSKENQEPFSPSPFMLGAKVELTGFRTWVRFAAGRMFVENRQLSAAGRLRSACYRQARFLWFWVTIISWPQAFQQTSDSPAGLPATDWVSPLRSTGFTKAALQLR